MPSFSMDDSLVNQIAKINIKIVFLIATNQILLKSLPTEATNFFHSSDNSVVRNMFSMCIFYWNAS